MTARFALPLALLSLILPPQQQAQPPTGTGLILGQVVDGTSGKPVSGVTVTISGTITLPENAVPEAGRANVAPPFPSRSVLTDPEGHFVFAALPPGRFSFSARKQGYLSGAYGERAPSPPVLTGIPTGTGTRLDVANNERRGDVKISLWKPATISGTVLDEAGEPMIDVEVRSARRGLGANSLAPGFQVSGTTDDRGMYRLSGLTPGSYIVMISTTRATMPSSIQDAFARVRQDGFASASGQQLNANGVSIPSFTSMGVQIGDFFLSSGNAAMLGMSARMQNPVVTDERKLQVYETTYYPAATTASRAALITVGSAETRANVDFQLKPVSTVRVSGTVTGPSGPEGLVGLSLTRGDVEDQLGNLAFDSATTIADASGAFTFLGVTPGQYVLRVIKTPIQPARTTSTTVTVIEMGGTRITSGGGPVAPPPIPNEPTLSATQPVAVGESDVTDVNVALTTGSRISGRILFEGTATPPAGDRIQQLTVTLEPLSTRARTIGNASLVLRGQFDANGRFSTYQIPNGFYVLRPATPANWTLKSVTLKGQDILDRPIELTGADVTDVTFVYTDTPSQLSGTVRADGDRPDGAAIVLVFPADPASWRVASSGARRLRGERTSALGTFAMVGLPPGEYHVVAVPNDQISGWPDPAFLQSLAPRATRLTLGNGEQKTQDLKTAVVR